MSEIIPPSLPPNLPPGFPANSSTTDFYRPIPVFMVAPPRPRYWLHGLLLLGTIFTTLVMGARIEFNFLHNAPAFDPEGLPYFPLKWALHPANLALGVPFSFTLMLILLAHEMGHYLYCRRYGVSATLPFFIPFVSLFGTLGAFIRIRSPIRSRAALFDIGIAGPIAGFLVALPILAMSLRLSRPMPEGLAAPDIGLGYPLIFYLAHRFVAVVASSQNVAAVPLAGVLLHPVAIAAWVGMFATSLNLLPGGQLDGGHIVFSLWPRAHRWVSRGTILALIPMSVFFWAGWLIWAVLLWISGMRHPMVPEWPGITGGRRWLAGFALLMLVLTMIPAPIKQGGQYESLLQVVREWRSGSRPGI